MRPPTSVGPDERTSPIRPGADRDLRAFLLPAVAVVVGLMVAVGVALDPAATFGWSLVVGAAVLAATRPRLAVPVVMGYATALGGLRRFTADRLDAEPFVDPLIVVIPVAALVLAVVAIRAGAMRDRSPLTITVVITGALAVLGILNPLQGSLLVGVGGLLFLGAPLLWFVAGRGIVDRTTLGRTYITVTVVTFVSALWGLAQSAGWFASWDRAWVAETTFFLGGDPRPFGLAASPGEYARMLAVATVIVVIGVATRRSWGPARIYLIAATVPLLVVASVLSSVRVGLVLLVLALAMAAAIRRGAGLATIVVAGLAGLTFVWVGAGALAPDRPDAVTTQGLDRQLVGLSDPLNSTADARLALVVDAVGEAVRQPAGSGTGVTTRVAAAVEGESRVTESDLADAAVSWGLPGLIAVATLVVLGFLTALRNARVDPSWMALVVPAVFVVATLRWLDGGLYPLAPLVLLGLGWADRPRSTTPADPDTAATTPGSSSSASP